MSSTHSMNARKGCPCNSQAFAHESSKVGGRGKREGDRKGRGQEADGRKGRGQEADGRKGNPTKKNLSEELKQGLPNHSSG